MLSTSSLREQSGLKRSCSPAVEQDKTVSQSHRNLMTRALTSVSDGDEHRCVCVSVQVATRLFTAPPLVARRPRPLVRGVVYVTQTCKKS